MPTQTKNPLKVSDDPYYLDWRNPEHRKQIDVFEELTRPYRNKCLENPFCKKSHICSYYLFLHDMDIFVFSRKYPFGIIKDLNSFRWAMSKIRALESLLWVKENHPEQGENDDSPKFKFLTNTYE
jgi:hypothetical protein